MYARDKAARFACKTAVGVSLKQGPQVSYQHWAGGFCFMAGFRRPLFSITSEICKFIYEFDEGGSELREPVIGPSFVYQSPSSFACNH